MSETDYTQKSSMLFGYGQQYRIQKYFRDVIANWFADRRNVKDYRLQTLLYNCHGELNKNCIKVGVAYDPDGIYSGTTPAIIISLGNITYIKKPINQAGNPAFKQNPMQAPVVQIRYKMIPIKITVVTESYDGTVLLTELLELWLVMNSQAFIADCKLLSAVNVEAISAPQALKSGTPEIGNAKQLYASQIDISAMSVVSWAHDTQGPVYRGLSIKLNT